MTTDQLEHQIKQLRERHDELNDELQQAMAAAGPDELSHIRELYIDRQVLREMTGAKHERIVKLYAQGEADGMKRAAENGWHRVDGTLPRASRSYFVQREGDDGLYVLKLRRLSATNEPEALRKEIRITLALDHPNILKAADYCLETPYLVTPYMEGGIVLDADTDNWSQTDWQRYEAAVQDALDYAKRQGYEPGDVNRNNIFLKADGRTPVLADLEGWREAV